LINFASAIATTMTVLLHVLEYENDNLWYDVHPIVITLLQREGLI
jgi:hypothetical protein